MPRPHLAPRRPAEVEAFLRWLDLAQPGECYLYWIGDLASDRGGRRRALRDMANALADAAWRKAMTGRVDLVQRRAGDHRWEYIAQRRRRPHTVAVEGRQRNRYVT